MSVAADARDVGIEVHRAADAVAAVRLDDAARGAGVADDSRAAPAGRRAGVAGRERRPIRARK